MDRYTALLTADVLEEPPRSARGAMMGTIWVRLMQNTWGRAAVAAVAAVLALTMWRSGTLKQILSTGETVRSWLPETTQTTEPEQLGRPVQDDERTPTQPEQLGKPVQDRGAEADPVPEADRHAGQPAVRQKRICGRA